MHFFIQIRTRAISCKQMTMVHPLHLLLFGSRKVEAIDGIVRLDNWINLRMNPKDAAAIVALRPALEQLAVRVADNPETFFPLQKFDQDLVDVVTELSKTDYHTQGHETTTGNNWQRN